MTTTRSKSAPRSWKDYIPDTPYVSVALLIIGLLVLVLLTKGVVWFFQPPSATFSVQMDTYGTITSRHLSATHDDYGTLLESLVAKESLQQQVANWVKRFEVTAPLSRGHTIVVVAKWDTPEGYDALLLPFNSIGEAETWIAEQDRLLTRRLPDPYPFDMP